MKFNETEVFNFKGALRGMRNPLESWHKSDTKEVISAWCYGDSHDWISNANQYDGHNYQSLTPNAKYDASDYARYVEIGSNDLDLAQRLILAGDEHAKFMRQIFVCVDITAPLYWYKEFDTYKVGTVANSTSTMHKLATTPITIDCFEIGDYEPELNDLSIDVKTDEGNDAIYCLLDVEHNTDNFILFLESLRLKYLETKDKKYWKELIRWLPESWLQTRTVTMSYSNLRNMYFQRRNHKLTEWSVDFIDWIKTLPYAEELIMVEKKDGGQN